MNKNTLVLAYIGDAIYEVYIREYLVQKGICKVKDLQKESIKYVSAPSQAKFLKNMLNDGFFTEDEIDIIKNARNHKNHHKPKNTDIVTYKYATALEALIGYLYYKCNIKRIEEIIDYIKEV